MILYFADRNLNILGQATTHLPNGVRVVDDLKTEDVETGCAIFECDIAYDSKTRAKVNEWTKTGNYILRYADNEYEVYNIIDREKNTKKKQVYLYAEDDGLDLLNEVVGKFEASDYQPISYYVNLYGVNAGWEIGINELEGVTRKLSFDSEQTASARLLSIAEAFNNAEISFSFVIDGLKIKKKLINIYEKRGKDTGEPLRVNEEIDSIITTETISNLATALRATGGTPDNAEEPLSLLGYAYDDGDFYVDGAVLKSRKAFDKWQRLIKGNQDGGHITKQFSYDTLSQAELCEKTIAELKNICDVEINYEIDITDFPDNVKIGDRVNIIDDADELYLSSRILTLETSITQKRRAAVIGENLIRKDGISSKVEKLAADFAKSTKSVERAKNIANNAKEIAEEAKTQANTALTESENAKTVVEEAKTASETAINSAANAQAEALAAQAAVEKVEESVSSLQTTVDNAQQAADNAQQAATTATEKAEEAKTASENAQKDATEAKNNAETAKTTAESAIEKAETAISQAGTAKTTAESASTVANAAKLDAENAQKDIDEWAENLETYKKTVTETYARKTDLTETQSTLQAQITANANELSVVHGQVTTIDETANNAKDLAEQAQSEAATAQSTADKATADALAAQQAANNAAAAAQNAQSEADTAKAAAATAQSVADKAQADLEAAQADLATVNSRVDATEAEIAAAEQAVENAKAAADKAQADADTAASKAAEAQSTADTAVTNAANAQTKANEAAEAADLAQQTANEAKGNAAAAQAKADEAAVTAAQAQATADTARANAETAQTTANNAATAAANAQKAADDAEAKALQAESDLATARQNLADVTSRVGATEEEIQAAQQAVETAQAAADKAKQDAATAQSTADKAKQDAANAQTAANNAKTAADNAQAAANEAQQAADKAQQDVNNLAVRVTTAETNITKNSEQIALMATKKEITTTLGGYYTKAETDAALTVKANEINSSVKSQIKDIKIGGRNLLPNSDIEITKAAGATQAEFIQVADLAPIFDEYGLIEYTLSFDLKSADTTAQTTINVYCQNGSNSKYAIGTTPITVTTEYKRYSITFTPSLYVETETKSMLAFYGGYGTGNIPSVKNIKLEIGNKATDWTPAPEDVTEATEAAQNTADDAISKVTNAESEIRQLAESISMLVTDDSGTSLMKQTANGWTFSTEKIQSDINAASESLNDLVTALGSTDAVVEVLKRAVEDIGKKTDYVNINPITYTNDKGETVTEPCIELGESENDYKVLITNTQILFKVGSSTPTRINADGLVTENITVENELRQTNPAVNGFYVWAMDENGYYGLMWKGADE